MKNTVLTSWPTTRREFLRQSTRGIGLMAFSRFAPSFLVESTLAATPAPEKDRTILVLVQLAGGNDGLNTVVPFEDADYYRLRPTLGIAKKDVLPISDTLGLHPECEALQAMFREGALGVVQNVGYPNPNRSHFRSTEIWETASDSGDFATSGWLGRFMDNACAGAPVEKGPLAVHLTDDQPQSFVSEHVHSTFGVGSSARGGGGSENLQLLENMLEGGGHEQGNASFLRHTMMDALVTEKNVRRVLKNYRAEASYPETGFANGLRSVAALIAGRLPTRVYFVSLSGFDTHSNQPQQHARLLRTLSEGLAAFQRDLKRHGLDGQVTTMTFSEFGRRPSENESRGTDHGTAAPLFVMGSRVNAGVHGTAPSLRLERNQDLAFSTDFRRVYATMLDRWLGCPAAAVLGREHGALPLMV